VGVLSGTRPQDALIDVRRDENTGYQSDRPAVALVSSVGVVTAVGPGTATITVTHRQLTATAAARVVSSAAGAPILRLSAPPDGAVLTSSPVTVAGTVSDPQAKVKVMGTQAPTDAVTGAFSVQVALSPGQNLIKVQADLAAGSALAELSVTLAAPGSGAAVGPDGSPLPVVPALPTTAPDRTPPQIAVQWPRPGALLLSTRVEVLGTVDEPQSVVRINGARAAVQDGAFSAQIVLPRGAGQIVAEAVDPVGNRSSKTVNVSVDSELPAVNIAEPAPSDLQGWCTLPEGAAVVSSSPLLVRGSLSHPGMRVWIQGAQAAVNGTGFSGTASLARGLNRLAVVAELPGDPPRRAIDVRRVVLDLDPPVIEVAYPPPGLVARTTPIRVIGRVRDPGVPPGASASPGLRINGTPVDASGGSFDVSVSLVAGLNSLMLEAADGADRRTSQTINVTLDATTAGASLEAADGGGQTVAPGGVLPRALVARVRDAAAAPVAGVPVIFRVDAGDGTLTGGAREIQVTSDGAGEARATFTAGRTAGKGLNVVTARSPGRRGSPAAFSVTVSPGALSVLAAHSPRWDAWMAGQTLPRPLLARALDAAGNPLAGVPV
ncbi:MAG TPA: Ig-like domain-containing protein, partial [Methylomirabilota bacterium]|nr:Ig-like domain-containing protein [Methylomirabilota bacterium]